MKRLVAVIFTLFLAIPAGAADLVCTVPAANVARSVELCEELRLQLRVRSTEWSNDVCASQFLRIGLLAGERNISKRLANTAVATLVNDAIVTYESTWARPTAAICGDGVLDSEAPFLEACDDANLINGDGCSDSCTIEP